MEFIEALTNFFGAFGYALFGLAAVIAGLRAWNKRKGKHGDASEKSSNDENSFWKRLL